MDSLVHSPQEAAHTHREAGPAVVDIDALAQEIRRIDGRHSIGAAALAEALAPFVSAMIATANAWHPLETAPKDGSWIIVTTKRLNVFAIRWKEGHPGLVTVPSRWVTKSGYSPDIRIDPDVIVGWIPAPAAANTPEAA